MKVIFGERYFRFLYAITAHLLYGGSSGQINSNSYALSPHIYCMVAVPVIYTVIRYRFETWNLIGAQKH